MSKLSVLEARKRRHRRVRGKIIGSAERPRLAVFRSNRGIEAQLIDDVEGRTLAAASWLHVKGDDSKADMADGGGQAGRRAREGRRHRDVRCSTAAATCTTDASRRSPRARAREG